MSDEPASPGPGPGSRPPRPAHRSRRERDFLKPPPDVPFHRTSEGQRMIGLGLLLFLVVAFLAMFRDRTPQALEKVFAAKPPPAVGTNAEAVAAAERERDARRRILEAEFGPGIDSVPDRADFAEEPVWRRVVETIAGYTPEFVRSRVTRSLNRDYDGVLARPEAYRGEFFRMKGICHHLQAKKLAEPIGGRTDVYRGIVVDTDGSNAVFFDLADPPPDFETRTDVIDVDGVFYRVARYETQRGKWVEVPWIVARTVVKIETARSDPTRFWFGAGATVVFLAIGLLIVYLIGRRTRSRGRGAVQPAGFREMFERRLREDRERRRREPPEPPRAAP